MAVESRHLLHDLTHADLHAIGDDDPTVDVITELPANVDPTEDVAAVDAPLAPPAAPSARGPDPFQPGTTLSGRYRLERVVGRGGFSQVFEAIDLAAGAAGAGEVRVAIKAPRPEHCGSDASGERLAREYELLRRLEHPGVVRVLDLGTEAGQRFEVLELLEGASLATRLAQSGGPLPREEALRVLRSCAGTLDWVHGQGFVHGDVKPGNIFVTAMRGTRLLDFCGQPSAPTSEEGVRPGEARHATPAYASPQVLSGMPPAPADDLYSFACVAFETLAGVHPFERASALEARERDLRPPAVAALDVGAAAALLRGLAFEHGSRPASAGELLDDVLAAGRGRPPRRADAPVAVPSPQRWRGPAALGVLALLAIAVAWGTWPTGTQRAGRAPGQELAATGEVPGGPAPREPGVTAVAPVAAADPAGGPDTPTVTDAPVRVRAPIDQDVAFATSRLAASRRATWVAIPVRRSGGDVGRVEVAWRIDEGSARAGRDFDGPLSGVLLLAEGQRHTTLFVPLVAAPPPGGDAAFAVNLEQVRGRARIAGPARVEVDLRDFND